MTSCSLCLTGAEILIPVYDASGSDSKGMAKTVAKFTGVQLSASNCSKICVSCWASVDNFQKFCCLVQQVHLERQLFEVVETERETETDKTYFAHEIEMELLATMHSKSGAANKVGASTATENIKDMLCCETEAEQVVKIKQEAETPTVESKKRRCRFKRIETMSNLEKEIKDLPQKVVLETEEELEMFVATEEVRHGDEVPESVAKSTKVAKHAAKAPKEATTSKRAANARKIGRPAKNDAAACLADDRLIASHIQLLCDVCQASARNFQDLMQHFKVAHQATGYAVCCRKRLYKRGLLIDHINVHKDPDYFKCEHCAHVFADRVCLRNHILLKHRSAAELCFQCEHCGKKFAKEYLLQRHLIMHMPGEERTHRCESCNKAYPSLSRLRAHHKNVHGDASLKVCNHCGKCMRGKTAFERHIEQHERPGGVSQRGVQCAVCADWLSDRYCLRVHMERHEPQSRSFACVLCGKTAPSRLAMNAHYRYHHGTQPEHKCEHCARSFRTQRGLREHVTTHTGETLYTCSYCDKKFKCSSNLHAHRKWQHPVEWARDRHAPKLIKPA